MKLRQWKGMVVALSLTLGVAVTGCHDESTRFSCATDWRPKDCRIATSDDPLLYTGYAWRNLQGDALGSGEVAIALAPRLIEDWVAEENTFNATGPVFDLAGNLYFSPLLPNQDVTLISIDPTGARRYAIPGTGAPVGAGAPMILRDPQRPGGENVYLGLYDRVIAIHTDGTLIWEQPTGLTPEPGSNGEHVFGVNYHPQADAVIGLTMDGFLYVLDRETGAQVLTEPYQLPGEPSPPGETYLPSSGFVLNRLREELDPLMDLPDDPRGKLNSVLHGHGTEVANFFSIDPDTGRLWVMATAPDAEDGVADGVSEKGALYRLELVEQGGIFVLEEICHATLSGVSASTPALRGDGSRIYVGDLPSRLLAIDTDCRIAWSLEVGGEITGSVTVASENEEVYASTHAAIVKVIDQGSDATIAWRYEPRVPEPEPGEGCANINIVTLGANLLVFQSGAGRDTEGGVLPRTVGVGLLDRKSGALVNFTQGLDETVAVMSVGPDGGLYVGNSPMRRAVYRALYGQYTSAPLRGGITRFAPASYRELLAEIGCAGALRAEKASENEQNCPESAATDSRQCSLLRDQALHVLPLALATGEIDQSLEKEIHDALMDQDPAVAFAKLNTLVSKN